ncbi:MAG: hypothetical protein ACRECP_04470 [Methylocella sp.]
MKTSVEARLASSGSARFAQPGVLIEFFLRFGAAGGDFRRSAIAEGVVQSRSTVIDLAEACDSALDFDEEIANREKVS